MKKKIIIFDNTKCFKLKINLVITSNNIERNAKSKIRWR